MTRAEFIERSKADMLGRLMQALLVGARTGGDAAAWMWMKQQEAAIEGLLGKIFDAIQPATSKVPEKNGKSH